MNQRWHNIMLSCIGSLFSLLLLAGLSYGLATPARAVGPIFVDDGTCPGAGAGTQLDPYCAIQDAVDAADPGDEIRVAEGTYTGVSTRAGVTQVVYIDKTVTLLGGYNADFSARNPDVYLTTLDAEGAGRVLYITGEITSTLDGLRLTGGDAGGLAGHYAGTYDAGGGMYVITATVTISNCSIYSNTASTIANGFGGGMYLYHSAFTLTRSMVTNNLASPTGAGYGGGIAAQYCSPVLLNDNTVANNTAYGFGGGLYLTNSDVTFKKNFLQSNIAGVNRNGNGGGGYFAFGTLTLDDNTVQDNTASVAATGYGGGLYLIHSSAVTLNRNTVQGNVASLTSTGIGGGMYSIDSVVVILNDNQVLSNTASASGGGIFLMRSSTFTLTNNLIAGNYLGSSGLFVGGSNMVPVTGRLIHNTIADNTGVNGVSIGDYVTLAFTNTILSGHSGTGIVVSTGSTATLEATLWYANGTNTDGAGAIFTGTVNVYDDPAFVSPVAWNYHISADSAAIDAGIDAGVPDDIDGDTRPLGSAPDIGADELDPIAPTGVDITGPDTAVAYATTEFTAGVSPVTATAPFTYVWQATGLPSVIHTGQDGEDTVSLTWSSAGPKTITVTASNAAGAAIDTHTVSVIAAPILAISKSGPAETVEGTPFTYTLTITNSGLAAASNLVITDVLPVEASYVNGGAYDPVEHAVTWTAPSLAANGGVAQVSFAVMATQALTNSDYTVSADDGYGAVGTEPVVTSIHPAWIRYVAPGGADSGNTCANSATPCATVQHAVNVANPTDEIRVAEGAYGPGQMVIDARTSYTYTQVVFITKTLILRGGYDATDWAADPDPDAHPAVIDAAQQGRGVSIVGASGDQPAVVIEGFTITGGDYTGLGNPAGVFNRVCSDYDADCGGGIFARYSALTVRNCSIHDNTAGSASNGQGGGLYLWNITAPGVLIDATTVISNSGQDQGGGLYSLGNTGLITIAHSTFRANSATHGGALYTYDVDLAVSDSDFISNTATGQSGGIHASFFSNVTMERVRFQDNQADVEQAALYLFTDASGAHARLANVLFSGNHTTATVNNADDAVVNVYNSGSNMQVDLLHVTAADNAAPNFLYAKSWGSGHYLTVALTNTLLVDIPTAFAASETDDGTTLIRHTHTLTNGVTILHTTLEGAPTFEALDPISGDARLDANYHLLSGSAAIDAGVDTGVLDDIDGDVRPQGVAPDIGADELSYIAPTGVSITGPDTVAAYAATDFTANVSPVMATAPFTYAWQATGLSQVTHTGQGNSDIASLVWTSIGTKTITVTASNMAGTVTDTHTVSVIGAPILAITKSGPAEVIEGTALTYVLTVTNSGLADASNLVITDVLPAGAIYVSGGNYDAGTHTVSWSVASLAQGSTAQVTCAVAATQTVTNATYGVAADGGYEAVGTEPVVTVVRLPWIRYVAPGGMDGSNACFDDTAPCATLQHAVDVANPEDEIRVAEGTYGPGQMMIDARTGYTYTQVAFITKTLTLRGGYDATDWAAAPDPDVHPTVIDAARQGRGVSIVGASGDRPAVVIEGFTITGGDYTGLGNPAGIYDRVCRNYEADCGGGLFAQYSALTVRHCLVHDNTAGTADNGEGGGLYLWNTAAPGVLIDATTVISNSGQDQGGGLYDFGSTGPITITHSTFRENSANYGGAMLIYDQALLHISDSDFVSNTATIQTGGVHFDSFAKVTMERVRFQDNQAYADYAALYLNGEINAAHVRLTNVLFSGNRTTATASNTDDAVVYIYNSKTAMQIDLLHVTAADNTTSNFLHAKSWGSGHYLTVALTNTLLVDIPTAFAASETNDGTTLIHHTHTLTDDVTTLHTTLEGTPTFEALDPISGDARLDANYHLLSGSAAIDAGVDTGVLDDIDGDVRPQGNASDIGADELSYTGPGDFYIYLPLVMRDR